MPPLDASPPDTPAAGHPFAPFVRTICRGEKLSRSLSREEAAEAMGMILSGRVDPIQLGAFLMVLRYRKETPEELAGFADAARSPTPVRWPSISIGPPMPTVTGNCPISFWLRACWRATACVC